MDAIDGIESLVLSKCSLILLLMYHAVLVVDVVAVGSTIWKWASWVILLRVQQVPRIMCFRRLRPCNQQTHGEHGRISRAMQEIYSSL
jgi:hypothetical protein